MTYVDGFVAAVPTANREIYKKHAEAAAVVFKEHGAGKVVECWGNDVPDGTTTSFPMAVKRKEDETVVFSWITWPSRKVRNEGMKKAYASSMAVLKLFLTHECRREPRMTTQRGSQAYVHARKICLVRPDDQR
jgi:uncharacterized protein YbaA (DUF1428 family)